MTPGVALIAALLSCLPLAAAPAQSPSPVPVRVGNHESYGRVVFDLPAWTDYQVSQQDQQVVIQFAADMTFGPVARVPRNVLTINTGAGRAEITILPGTVVRDWRLGDRVVIDVMDQAAFPSGQRQTAKPAAATGPQSQEKPTPADAPAPAAPVPAKSPPPAAQATRAPAAKPAANSPSSSAPAPAAPPKGPDTPSAASAMPAPPPASPDKPPASQAASPPPTAEVPPPAASMPAPAVGDASASSVQPAEPESDLVVPFETPLGVATFRRGTAAMVVLDQQRPIDLTALHDDPVFGTAKVEMLPAATVIRLRLDADMALSVSQVANAWHITAVPDVPKLQQIPAAPADGRLILSAVAPGDVVSVADPETGSTLLVGTLRREGQGVAVERRSVEYTLLPTWQGVAVEPIADTLALRATQTGFVLTGGPGGLVQSPPSDIADQLQNAAGVTRHFDFPSQPVPALMQRLVRLIDDAAATPPLSRAPRREAVARAMISLGLGADAQAVLAVAAADDPREAASPDNAALASMAALLAHRPGEAAGLNDPRLAEADDIAFWRAVRLAELHAGSAPAAAAFATTLPLVLAYPQDMRDRVLPLVAETLVTGGQTAAATALLNALKDDAALDLARGMLRETQGDTAGALAIYDRLAESSDRLLHARAAVRAVELRLASGEINAKDGADRLDRLLYAWRGDARERSLRERLAELRATTGAWRSALNLLRDSETLFPNDKAAIHGELTDMFAALLRDDTADTLAPLELVSVVDENTDLLPTGSDGEALEARLADRLLALDLPMRAAPVLEKLMQQAPTGPGRATFGARLAALHLREGDATGALAALSGSAAADLPSDLSERRTLLFADASARHGDVDHALAALASLDSAAADEARATIAERANDWAGAQRALLAYAAKTVPPDGALDDGQRRTLLRLATAAARAGDGAALTDLRQQDGPRMGSGPLADMFRLLTAGPVHSVADLKRSEQEATLARALPDQLKALQPPAHQIP